MSALWRIARMLVWLRWGRDSVEADIISDYLETEPGPDYRGAWSAHRTFARAASVYEAQAIGTDPAQDPRVKELLIAARAALDHDSDEAYSMLERALVALEPPCAICGHSRGHHLDAQACTHKAVFAGNCPHVCACESYQP